MTLPAIKYCGHALTRMRERMISHVEVEQALTSRKATLQPNGRLCAKGQTGNGARLRVVYEDRFSPSVGPHVMAVTVLKG